jgi:hypothetical protein
MCNILIVRNIFIIFNKYTLPARMHLFGETACAIYQGELRNMFSIFSPPVQTKFSRAQAGGFE